MYDETAKSALAPTGGQLSISQPTITEQLQREKQGLEERLAKVTEALTALQANPEVEKILNLISKVHRY